MVLFSAFVWMTGCVAHNEFTASLIAVSIVEHWRKGVVERVKRIFGMQ